MTTTTDAVQTDATTGTDAGVYTYNAHASELARVLANVFPHADSDPALPVLWSVGVVPTGKGFAFVATDRYTLAVATGETWKQSDSPKAYDVLAAGALPVFKLSQPDCKTLIADMKRLKQDGVIVEVLSGDAATVDGGTLTIRSLNGEYQRTFIGLAADFPRYGKLVPDAAELTGYDNPGGFAIGMQHIAKLAKVNAKPVGVSGRVTRSHEPVRFQMQSHVKPILVTIGDTFTGLVMPTRLAG